MPGAVMRPSEWLLVVLSTIKSQGNTLTVQPRRKGGPGNQMIIPSSIVENMATRCQYTKEEDQRILDFVRGKKDRISGNQLWREAEYLEVTKSCKMSNSNPF